MNMFKWFTTRKEQHSQAESKLSEGIEIEHRLKLLITEGETQCASDTEIMFNS